MGGRRRGSWFACRPCPAEPTGRGHGHRRIAPAGRTREPFQHSAEKHLLDDTGQGDDAHRRAPQADPKPPWACRRKRSGRAPPARKPNRQNPKHRQQPKDQRPFGHRRMALANLAFRNQTTYRSNFQGIFHPSAPRGGGHAEDACRFWITSSHHADAYEPNPNRVSCLCNGDRTASGEINPLAGSS